MLRLKFDAGTPARELARDEAMLQWADSMAEQDDHSQSTQLFRVWKFTRPTVVLGRSSKFQDEVNLPYCDSRSIEVLRRCTGGASVVGGPGCLMYSVVIAVPSDGGLRKIDVAHDFVMQRVLAAVQDQLPHAKRLGICDLTLGQRKFSGNSLRVARHHLLYHGTILLSADLEMLARCLDFAPRQPEYRQGRSHHDFVTNIDVQENQLVESLAQQFETNSDSAASNELVEKIEEIANALVLSRYNDPAWHTRR
ncbi:lipoate--protein ligase family protein [Neorhodopirellula lusitana]|uniref:lipoate--protein ligase family protein n=1 Tax=Neorhodopirellula lusitana TaxID=445327 RepID=UPI00384EF515